MLYTQPPPCIVYIHSLLPGPSLLLVVEGSADMTISEITYRTMRGVVIFIAAGLKIDFVRVSSHEILMYRAYCDL